MDLQPRSPCPFKPEAGAPPALLAGRDEEMELLTEIIVRLKGAHSPLAPLFPPVKIEGPRGVGKTALLNWAKGRAKVWKVRCVACEAAAHESPGHFLAKLMKHMASGLAKKAIDFIISSPGPDIETKLAEEGLRYTDVLKEEACKEPLLLLIDEAQHLDLSVLRKVTKACAKLIRKEKPLGLVLAGRTGFDQNAGRDESALFGSKIYISELSDQATREALWLPFEYKGVPVTPAALEAMAAQTENHPYYTQLVGQEVWAAMAKAGRKGVDTKLALQVEGKVREGRRHSCE